MQTKSLILGLACNNSPSISNNGALGVGVARLHTVIISVHPPSSSMEEALLLLPFIDQGSEAQRG